MSKQPNSRGTLVAVPVAVAVFAYFVACAVFLVGKGLWFLAGLLARQVPTEASIVAVVFGIFLGLGAWLYLIGENAKADGSPDGRDL